MREYRVEIIKESLFGNVSAKKFQDYLNKYTKEGWQFVDFQRETRRSMLFFTREAFIIILEKEG